MKKVREENTLDERTKGKTKEGASELMTLGDLRSHKKMFYLMKNTYPALKVHAARWETRITHVEMSTLSHVAKAVIKRDIQ